MARQNPPNKQKIPNTFEIDPDIDTIGFPISFLERVLEDTDRPLEVLGLLMTYLYGIRKNGGVPSIPTICEWLGIGKDKARAIRNSAKEADLIQDYKIRNADTGRIIATRTAIHFPNPRKTQPLGNPTLGEPLCNIIIKDNNIYTPANPTASGFAMCEFDDNNLEDNIPPKKKREKNYRLDEFEQFYKAYPRKRNKTQALKNWKTAINQKELPTIDFILSRLQDFKDIEWKQLEDERWVPHPGTWISGRQWNDVLNGESEKQSNLPPKRITNEGEEEEQGNNWLTRLRENDLEVWETIVNNFGPHFLYLSLDNKEGLPDKELEHLLIPIAKDLIKHDLDPREWWEWAESKQCLGKDYLARSTYGGKCWDEFILWRDTREGKRVRRELRQRDKEREERQKAGDVRKHVPWDDDPLMEED